MKTVTIVGVVVLAVLIAAAVYAALPKGTHVEPVIIATMPELAGDLQLLISGCNYTVKSLLPPGVDPHTVNLNAESARMVKSAVLVVSSGHAPYELQIRDLGLGKRLIDIREIPGIRFSAIPGDGVNVHMPIYDLDNYAVYINYTASRLAELIPECKTTIYKNLNMVLEKLAEYYKCKGLLNGTVGVAASPFAQYAVEWLGVNVTVIISASEEWSSNPQTLLAAEDYLKKGAIAIVSVDDKGQPINEANRWLYEKAQALHSRTIFVEPPWTPGSILDKLGNLCANIMAKP